MKTIVIAFEYVSGRHTAENIKLQYDLILKRYNIEDKVFKVVADQAANMKKALMDVQESTSITAGASEDNIINITKLLIERRRKLDYLEEQKQKKLIEEINQSIDKTNNQFANKASTNSRALRRDDVLIDFDEITDEISESADEIDELEATVNDVDEEEEDIFIDPESLNFVFDAYLACAAHNGQLVLKDGLKLDEAYTILIKKVSKDIVSKTRISLILAEEIRKIDKTLKNYVITRWNSILFMIRSVLKLTEDDFNSLRSHIKKDTKKRKKVHNKFRLSETERAMLIELESLLNLFDWMTNEFQSKY